MTRAAQQSAAAARQSAFAFIRQAEQFEARARDEERRAARWGCARNDDAQRARREANAAWDRAFDACDRAARAEQCAA